ncbi:MAG: hypothetical protein M3619_00605 [Myxococcota bacterium]|nr:hypothetical protein [Myxococcota bacterium]
MSWATPKHKLSIIVSGVEIEGWEVYEVNVSMTAVPGTFTMRLPFNREAWDACREDRPCQILVDGTPIVTGFIDDSDCSEDGDWIDITGRCRMARLLESAPAISFAGLGIKELAAKVVTPWFSSVTLSNARNRTIVRGRGKKARTASEPVKINTKVGTQIEPGQTRWAVLERLLEQAGYLAWSSGDGRELVIGKPNYDQGIQFRFFRPAPGSARATQSTVVGMHVRRSTGDRYSRVIVVGSGSGTDVNYGAKVAARYGEAKNNKDTTEGEGRDFIVPKRLIVVRSVKSTDDATELAQAEMARRDAQGNTLTVRASGHGQVIAGSFTTLFGTDLLATVQDEVTGLNGIYAIVACRYSSGRGDGEETVMDLVRRGTEVTR